MRPRRFKTILVFVLGMLTFAVGWFIVATFIIVERPTRLGIIEDWERICFWPDVDGMTAAVSPKGCYSTTCTRPTLQAGTAIVDRRENIIQLETRFVLVEASRFPLPCIENCAGGGTVQFKLGKLMPNDYEVWFREEKVGELMIFSGRTTPRQCFESIPGLGGSSESSTTGIKFDPVGPHLPEGAEVSEHLIATLELDENIDASDEPIPTTVAEPRRKASSYWNEMEDPHYGVRFAVPCFWSVDFPEIYRPGGIGYSIRNYTDEYARSFGKMESGVWESGGIKIDMNFISGDGIGVSGTQPGASLLDFAVGLFDSNPEVALISTEPRTINGQES